MIRGKLARLICRWRGHRYRPHEYLLGDYCTRCGMSRHRERYTRMLGRAIKERNRYHQARLEFKHRR